MNNPEFEAHINIIPDFPKAGVIFKDVSPLLANKLDEVITEMGKDILWSEVDLVLGIESRGFILGAALATKFNKGFLPIRKKGKLPPPIISEEYTLEYGKDILEMAINSGVKNIVLVDDVLATGGTLKAALKLCERNKLNVMAVSMLINLRFLNNMEGEISNLTSVLNYN